MRVKKFLRETYWGDEFLIEDDGEDQVLKIVKASVDRSFFFNEYAKLKRLRLPNVLLPERLKISDGKFLLFYPYYHNLAPLENLSDQVAKQLLKLFLFLSKVGVTIPALGMDDILVNDGVFLIPATHLEHSGRCEGRCFFSREIFPGNRRSVQAFFENPRNRTSSGDQRALVRLQRDQNSLHSQERRRTDKKRHRNFPKISSLHSDHR
jgi:hypothetical protein